MWNILCGRSMVLFSQLSFEDSVQIMSVFAKHKTNNSYLYQCCLVQMWFMFCIQWPKLCKILYFLSNLHVNCRWTSPRSWGSQENNRGTFSFARSFVPRNGCAVDKRIEETFMKHAKSTCGGMDVGISCTSNNPEAYQWWNEQYINKVNFLP